ncbi:MAG: heavy metal translocating P-type ATPase [Peptoniphilaceae bacterium]|uniref:heavy metal translocating P-type ATPase n=1 Tax=Parvimonas sp. TaxID=1944660 RepID=UPI002A75F14D|nr:heavy metal translocating P-type ATPase [Parvimonas sp.]MDD7764916.1 heavy metal translocating P-type ATPase [Peptoniphilaceae bacterium]MDY3050648.1 heavy metal translocating P-type ATPase [Parvimonas sp.]
MRKVFLLDGIDCPNCSLKIENKINDLDGVNFSKINLVTQTVEIDFEIEVEKNLLENVKKIVNFYEPDVEVKENVVFNQMKKSKESNKNLYFIAFGSIIYLLSLLMYTFLSGFKEISIIIFIVSYVVLGFDVVSKAMKNIFNGIIFDENFLMTLSTLGAFVIGEYPEAVAVMLFYQIGEYFQSRAINRSRKSISDLMDIRPDYVNIENGEKLIKISPEKINVGDEIIIKPGEKIALDGVILSGESMMDTKSLTGESIPKCVKVGDEILSGCINMTGILKTKVTKSFGESTASKIINLVEGASSNKADTENFITSFAIYYTPIVVVLATLLSIIPPIFLNGEWISWVKRGFVFLVISCPCALVISIPLSYFSAIGLASKNGILVKGGNYLEALSKIDTIIFDKTGTLTKGNFEVCDIYFENGFTADDVCKFSAYAESFSNHPIAVSILYHYGKEIDKNKIINYKDLYGYGISATIFDKKVLVGNEKLMKKENISYSVCNKPGTIVYVAIDGKYAGYILIKDKIKDDSIKAISDLKNSGVKNIVMFTGDNYPVAKDICDKLKIDKFFSGMLPHEKVEKLELLETKKEKSKKIVFVGDGVNDAPVLARADVGVSMGSLGSDAAVEASDVVLMTDEISKLVEAIKISKLTKRIVLQNIIFILTIKIVFLVLGAFGLASMWEAVFGDVGAMIIAVLNSIRILKN